MASAFSEISSVFASIFAVLAEIAVAFLQNFGGSKVKRDKGGMPGGPGYRQKLRQAKSLPQLTRCYGFGKVLRSVCRNKG